ncbi:MAG: hypothetical protein J3R72DRAFT_456901 [Linnemannia gamsii]|nr:MAG: hypothetical protein J3R72DRAFT_456901 [Linnemannia gamsii]
MSGGIVGGGRHGGIASMGLGLGSAGIEAASTGVSSALSLQSRTSESVTEEGSSLPLSVSQRTKEYNNKSAVEPDSSSSTTTATGGKVVPSKVKNAVLVSAVNRDKGDTSDESEAVGPPPSVSELKKSFGPPPVVNASSKPNIGTTTTSSPSSPSQTGLKSASIGSTTPGNGHQVLPVIPTVKPLSFTGASLTTKVGGNQKGHQPQTHHGVSSNNNKVKMAGLGSLQAASVFKPSSSPVTDQQQQQESQKPVLSSLSGGPKKIVKSEGSVEDIKPASGSVKQAIAALKGNNTTGSVAVEGEVETGDGAAKKGLAVGGAEEEEEEGEGEKVDAFAFWKSK